MNISNHSKWYLNSYKERDGIGIRLYSRRSLTIGRSYRKKKGKSRSRNTGEDGEVIRIRIPEEGEVLGQVIQNLGGRLLLVRCTDEKTRQVMIPGKYRRRMWVRVGDVILLIPLYDLNPDEKGMLEFRYSANEAQQLYQRGLIPEEYIIS